MRRFAMTKYMIFCFIVLFSYGCSNNYNRIYKDIGKAVVDKNSTVSGYYMFFKTTTDEIAYYRASDVRRNLYYSSEYEGLKKILCFEK